MSAINIATNALTTNQAVLQVIGHNIANANTEGYTRQRAELQAVPGQQLGSGYYGKGVQIETVARVGYDAALTREANNTKASAAAETARYQLLRSIESLFPMGQGSLGEILNNALNAWVDVANSPNDPTARQVVLSRLEALATRVQGSAQQLEELGASARLQATEVTKEINRLAAGIAKVNEAIARVHGSGIPPNDLLDQRDRLIAQLNAKVQVSTVPADDGTLSVFVAGSLPLVLGNQAAQLRISRLPLDGDRQVQLQFVQGNTAYEVPAAFVSGGELKGLLDFINGDLIQTQAELGRMALALADSINRQQRSGVDLLGNGGQDLLNFSLTPLAASTNTGSATLGLAVDDATALRASDYVVEYVSGGNVTIRRSADGLYFNGSGWGSAPTSLPPPTLVTPITFDGLALSLGSGTPSVGDRFYLRPGADAAASITLAQRNPAAVAAASRVVVQAGTSNVGTATVTGVSATLIGNATWPVPPSTATLTYSGGIFTVSGAGWAPAALSYTPGQPMTLQYGSPAAVTVQLILAGTPDNGFQLTLAEPTNPSAPPDYDPNRVRFDGDNARAMLALRDQVTFDGTTKLSDGYVAVFSGLASRINEAQTRQAFAQAQADDAEQRRANQAGVNLDEEAARLLQFQQAYQASAKYLQTVQSIFDTLIATFR